MPRGTEIFNKEAQKDSLSPILLVRILDIPSQAPDLYKQESLYLTDMKDYVIWYDEKGYKTTYIPCGLTYNEVEVSTDNPICSGTLKMDNVNRQFSALAQYYYLNGVKIEIYRCFRDTLYSEDGGQLVMSGKLKKVLIGETSIEAEVWCDFSLRVKIPRRLYSVNLFPYIPTAKDVRMTFHG